MASIPSIRTSHQRVCSLDGVSADLRDFISLCRLRARPSALGDCQEVTEGRKRIGFTCGFVLSPAQNPRKANRDPRLVSGRSLYSLESKLEDLLRLHGANRPELLYRISTDPCVELADLRVGKPGVRLGERNECFTIANGECVIGVQKRATPVPRLGVNHDRIDRVRLQLPLPPPALPATHSVHGIATLQHEPLRPECTGSLAGCANIVP